jgi:hypothetical protein
MKLSPKALALTCALLWGGGLLFVGLVNLKVPWYGGSFLHAMSSVYPGFHDTGNLTDLLVGTGEALLDGVVGGALFALLYNAVIGRPMLRH